MTHSVQIRPKCQKSATLSQALICCWSNSTHMGRDWWSNSWVKSNWFERDVSHPGETEVTSKISHVLKLVPVELHNEHKHQTDCFSCLCSGGHLGRRQARSPGGPVWPYNGAVSVTDRNRPPLQKNNSITILISWQQKRTLQSGI